MRTPEGNDDGEIITGLKREEELLNVYWGMQPWRADFFASSTGSGENKNVSE
jgi:hypothetical protein